MKLRSPLPPLDLAEFVVPRDDAFEPAPADGERSRLDALYDLTAVVNHSGSLRGGHYTCYARAAAGGDADAWVHLNDSSVSAIDRSRVVTPAAYILMYTRRDVAAAPGALREAFGAERAFARGHEKPIDVGGIRLARWVRDPPAAKPKAAGDAPSAEEGDAKHDSGRCGRVRYNASVLCSHLSWLWTPRPARRPAPKRGSRRGDYASSQQRRTSKARDWRNEV